MFLRNPTLGLAHPDVTVRDCFGDRGSPADLCPAHPDVRAYAVALARAVARQGVDSVVAESLHFRPLKPRAFASYRSGRWTPILFGLCFCDYCMRRAADLGVNAEVAREECARIVGGVLDGDPPAQGEVTRAALTAYAGPEVVAYARARSESVTSLVSEVAVRRADRGLQAGVHGRHRRRQGLRATACPRPAWPRTTPGSSASTWWRSATWCPSFGVLAYARDAARVADDVAAYRGRWARTGSCGSCCGPGCRTPTPPTGWRPRSARRGPRGRRRSTSTPMA